MSFALRNTAMYVTPPDPQTYATPFEFDHNLLPKGWWVVLLTVASSQLDASIRMAVLRGWL